MARPSSTLAQANLELARPASAIARLVSETARLISETTRLSLAIARLASARNHNHRRVGAPILAVRRRLPIRACP
ncbi:MAG: hypothetical protein ACAF41_14260 [Leptolyngbya sp. BL-A-14]